MKSLFFFFSLMLCTGVAGAECAPDYVCWSVQKGYYCAKECLPGSLGLKTEITTTMYGTGKLVGSGNEKGDFINLPGIQPESDLEKRIKALEDCVYDPCHSKCPKMNNIIICPN